jgi:hypothetical protein
LSYLNCLPHGTYRVGQVMSTYCWRKIKVNESLQ